MSYFCDERNLSELKNKRLDVKRKYLSLRLMEKQHIVIEEIYTLGNLGYPLWAVKTL